MSINLDNVKAIVHNNKNVVKIENSHGIVWQAPPSEGWHTVWEGNQTFPSSQSASSYKQKICDLPIAMWNYDSSHFKLRLTYSAWVNDYSTSYKYQIGRQAGTTVRPASPIEVTIDPGTYDWGNTGTSNWYKSSACSHEIRPNFLRSSGTRYVPGIGSFQKYLTLNMAHNGGVVLTTNGYILTSAPTALEFGMGWEKNDAVNDNYITITKIEAYY